MRVLSFQGLVLDRFDRSHDKLSATISDVSLSAEQETFRPTFGRLIAGTLIAGCAFAALSLITEGVKPVVRVWPWLALVGLVGWALYWRPKVVVNAGGVRVVNVFRTIDIPWPAIQEIETKWALTISTAFGNVRAWAAPAPGRQLMRRAEPADRKIGGYRGGDVVRTGDLLQSESGAAAQIIRQRLLHHRKAGHLDEAKLEFDHLPIHWHWGVLGGFAIIAPLAVVSLYL